MSTDGTVQSDFAKRQLERMGWKEGNGLGKDRQGRAAPIIVKQRPDVTGGLGIEKEKVRQVQHTIQDEWWKDALGDTLSKLCDKKEKKKKKRKRDTSTDDKSCEECESTTESTKRKKTFTDEELFIATGGARFGMRAGKTRNQAKWRRTEEREVELLVQHQHQKNGDTIVDHCSTTTVRESIETSHTSDSIVNTDAPIVDCKDVSIKKSKDKELRAVSEKSKREKRVDSKLKTKKAKTITHGSIEHPSESEPSYADSTTVDTIPANPRQQEKRRKKKKKKPSSTVE
jgi:hypothetical protein